MKITENGYNMMLFVQQRLYEGLQPDEDGYYIIRRKEFIERLPMTSSTFAKQIKNLTKYYMQEWDLQIMFGLKGLARENLYTDISYESGKLRFKRNPYTLREELQYVWARKPFGWEERRFSYNDVPVPENVHLPIEKIFPNKQ